MSKRVVISLFTGAGGLDVGLEAAGFEVGAAVEIDADAVRTIRANRDWPLVVHRGEPVSVEHVTGKDLLRLRHLGEGEVDLLSGGPPCQPFSKAGYWATGDSGRLKDPRSKTLCHFLRLLGELKPTCFLLENVPGLRFSGKDEGFAYIKEELNRMNKRTGTRYTMVAGKLNAAHFGVPQARERVFVIGHRDGREFEFPAATHALSDQATLPDLGAPAATCWDAIGDLEDDPDPSLLVTGKWADLLPSIPEGLNYLWHTDRGGGQPLFGWRRKYWTFLLKTAKKRPASTIQAQPGPAVGPFHWKNRRLSTRELCRLQTLPDDYTIAGNLRTAQRLLGNAVPAAMAELLGLQIRRQLLGHRVRSSPRLIPEPRTPVPDPEPVRPVPRKYLHLVGTHADHPGTGQGPAAVARHQVERVGRSL